MRVSSQSTRRRCLRFVLGHGVPVESSLGVPLVTLASPGEFWGELQRFVSGHWFIAEVYPISIFVIDYTTFLSPSVLWSKQTKEKKEHFNRLNAMKPPAVECQTVRKAKKKAYFMGLVCLKNTFKRTYFF